MLILTNFIVIALALFFALVVAACAANGQGQPLGDSLLNSEWRTTLGPNTADADGPPVNQPKPPHTRRVAVLGQPLKLEQGPMLVHDTRKRA